MNGCHYPAEVRQCSGRTAEGRVVASDRHGDLFVVVPVSFPQDDAPDWALFVQQVGYTGPGGFFVNHTVFAAIACMHDCDLTSIQSMLDDTHTFQLLSGKSLALQLNNHHYDETVQWRKANVQGVVQPLFLAQRGMEHIMGTELLS